MEPIPYIANLTDIIIVDFLAAMSRSGENQSDFSILGTDAAFGSRSKDVFAGLATIEAKHAAFENTPGARRESAALMKPDPGEEEATSAGGSEDQSFRAPTGPPRKRIRSSASNNVPGFQAEPSKWTMYDLSDVADSHMSEKSNRGAAMEFMLTRRSKDAEDDVSSDPREDSSARHVFRKPVRNVGDEPATSGGRAQRGSSGRRQLRAVAEEEREDNGSDEDGATDERDAADGQKNDCGVGGKKRDPGLAFSQPKGHQRGRCVRRRGSDSDEDGNGENATSSTEENKAAAMTVTEGDSDSDDFSELAAAGPESGDDDDDDEDDDSRQQNGKQYYVSDMGVVSAVPGSRFLAENDDSNGDLDGVD
jgi:hypothetical protein